PATNRSAERSLSADPRGHERCGARGWCHRGKNEPRRAASGHEGAERPGGAGPEHLRRLDEVALHEIDAVVPQPVEVLLLLDLLRDHPELERARELDHGGDHLTVDLVRREV